VRAQQRDTAGVCDGAERFGGLVAHHGVFALVPQYWGWVGSQADVVMAVCRRKLV
jgi:hypothetical protein